MDYFLLLFVQIFFKNSLGILLTNF